MAFGTPWVEIANLGSDYFHYIASSSDGSYLVGSYSTVGSSGGGIYVSSNQGVTWTRTLTADNPFGVCTSADGSIMYAAVYGDKVYASTDHGQNWTGVGGTGSFKGVACSSDGSKVLASATDKVMLSTNTGSSWTQTLSTPATSGAWTFCAASDDFSVLYVAMNGNEGGTPGGRIRYSTDSGSNWNIITDRGYFSQITCSSDGTTMFVGTNSGGTDYLWATSNYGSSWTYSSASANGWNGLAISADGTLGLAATQNGDIYYTTDSGATWVAASSGVTGNWYGLATTDDGALSIASNGDRKIYSSTYVVPVALAITSITPNTGSTAGGTSVTISGTGFDPAATAAIDGNEVTDLVVVGSTTITGVTPAGTAGAKDVTVTNP